MLNILSSNELNKIIELRKTIHSNPELAHQEFNTAGTIMKFLENKSDEIISGIGGTGIAFIYKGKEEGKTILLRADLDALPIKESNVFPHKSSKDNVSHKCGHDGHMAILAGLGSVLSKNRIEKGKVVLLFQPAEEIGEGAEKVLNDKKFKNIKPDFVYAIHNLPGYEMKSVITRYETFASASKGMIIKLFGKTSHAAEPENGNSPATAMTRIINELNNLVISLKGKLKDKLKDFSLITVIHARLGEKAFGTTPGYAEVMATLRSYRNDDMNTIVETSESLIKKIAEEEKLQINISYTEEFPATVNNKECIELLKETLKENKFLEVEKDLPFKWSEDFGHFTSKYKGALFGIGAGVKTPQLHNPDYDFPDEIIETGITIYYSLIKKILG